MMYDRGYTMLDAGWGMQDEDPVFGGKIGYDKWLRTVL